MLPLNLVLEIKRLLEEGELSQRQIATRLHVSRGTVGAIASGRRGMHGQEPDPDDAEFMANLGPAVRCPGCGARVYLPCVLCRAREYQERHSESLPGAASSPRPRRVA